MKSQPSDEACIEAALNHMRALFQAAALAEREGRLEDAEALLRERIRLAPWDPIAKYGLSQLLLKRGDYEEGFALYEARTEIPQVAGKLL
jgi:tetratricopeptide (TPR) repeat protein